MADPDRPEQVPGPGKSRRIYTRGGRLSDLERLLAKNETERESRLVWRLVIAGIAIAVVIEATLAADPAHEDGMSRTTLKLRLDEPRYSLDAASRDGVRIGSDSIPGISASHTVTIQPPDNDGNRQADTVTLRAFLGTEGNLVEEDALPIAVADVDGLPAVAAAVVDGNGRPSIRSPSR